MAAQPDGNPAIDCTSCDIEFVAIKRPHADVRRGREAAELPIQADRTQAGDG